MRETRTLHDTRAPDGTSGGGGYYASVTVRMGSVQPETVLASAPGGVRGFWQSGSHWIAHVGSVVEIDGRALAAPQADVVSWVIEQAGRHFGEPWIHDLDGESKPPRFHGGLAFDLAESAVGPDGLGFWEPFPRARFILPAIEVDAGPEDTRLTVTRRYHEDLPRDQAIDKLRQRADRTRERLVALERAGPVPSPVPAATSIDEPVDARAWRGSVERILGEIERGTVRKVVLARPLDVTLSEVADPAGVLAGVRSGNPLAHTYLLQFSRDRFLVGAAPELIGRLEGGRFHTMAVAGSIPRGADPESDEWLGHQLRNSHKNLIEHQIVVEDIVEHLVQIGLEVSSLAEPELLRLPRIQHLRTQIDVEVPAGMHILMLVRALHPTAAVCGYPRAAAHAILADEERVPRGWYSGPVGWFDDEGNGEFAPALRCAVGWGPLLRLYAGAGIVEGSRPLAEWDETRVKLQTMLQALDVARVP